MSTQLRALHDIITIPKPTLGSGAESEINHVLSGIEKLMSTFLSLLRRRDGGQWALQTCGSYHNGNKVGKFNEIDFVAVLTDFAGDIFPATDESNHTIFKVSMPASQQHFMRVPIKQYLHLSLTHYLGERCRRPINPACGQVYARTCFPYNNGPGVCTELAWHCQNNHSHYIGVGPHAYDNLERQENQGCLDITYLLYPGSTAMYQGRYRSHACLPCPISGAIL